MPDTGLVIGADNITLDLNGHTIGGDGATSDSCPEDAACDVGIDNSAGRNQHGILLESSDQNEGSNDNEIMGNRMRTGLDRDRALERQPSAAQRPDGRR